MPLYIVATPIGRTDDVSARAIRVLRDVDVVLAEDTRRSGRLLRGLGIEARLRSYHEHTSPDSRASILNELADGRAMALISDAGTPAISDPGYRLVVEARARGIEVTAVPGPSAITAFLSAAGLPTDVFTFAGFPPRRSGERLRFLQTHMTREATLVLYESPRRTLGLLEDVAAVDESRAIVVARELTKIHEEWISGTAAKVLAELSSRDAVLGEIVVGVAPAAQRTSNDEELDAWVNALADLDVPVKQLSERLAAQLGRPGKLVYRAILAAREGD